MKANEMMIGDWVTCKKWRENPFKLTRINDNGKYYYGITSNETQVGPFLLDEIEPIPLTTEILKKNGFDTSDPEVKQYHFTEDGQSYHFSLRQMYSQKDNKPNGYSFYAFSVLTIIDYVHQLQHALKLCGIEKEIEL